jgi:hypothetical protein
LGLKILALLAFAIFIVCANNREFLQQEQGIYSRVSGSLSPDIRGPISQYQDMIAFRKWALLEGVFWFVSCLENGRIG